MKLLIKIYSFNKIKCDAESNENKNDFNEEVFRTKLCQLNLIM